MKRENERVQVQELLFPSNTVSHVPLIPQGAKVRSALLVWFEFLFVGLVCFKAVVAPIWLLRTAAQVQVIQSESWIDS